MRNRVLAVFGLILAYRFLAHVPVPLAEPSQLKDVMQQAITQNSFGGFLNLLSGGASQSIYYAGRSKPIYYSLCYYADVD